MLSPHPHRVQPLYLPVVLPPERLPHPRHEALRGHVTELLREAFGAPCKEDLQVVGEAGTRRHLDNLVWTLPIPECDPAAPLHNDLAAAAIRAEAIAAATPLPDSAHFTAKRSAIRAALAENGVAAEIEALVDALLPP